MDNTIIPKIFNIYKPVGMTSGDVVYHFKKNLQRPFGKIGHFGTLDPFAEGVLLIGVGGSCRLADYVHQLLPKTYLATGLFGEKMTTGDIEGEVSENKQWEHLNTKDSAYFQSICSEFLGDYLQVPPAFSATKHKGKALYKWAREGSVIIKPPVKRFIHAIEFVEIIDNKLTFRVTVSTGTYIRTLFEDIAEKLDTVGHLISLKRESIGQIDSLQALTKEYWPLKGQNQDHIHYSNMPELLPFRSLVLDAHQENKYSNGISVELKDENLAQIGVGTSLLDIELALKPYLWVYGHQNNLIGLGELHNNFVKTSFNLPQKQA